MPPTISRGDRQGSTSRDHKIQDDIRAELATEPVTVDPCLVAVAVDDGVVRLTGVAESYMQKYAFARAAGRVVGVREVRDHVEVRPPGEHRRGDARIERAARRVLAWDARVPSGVRVEITDGVLRLRGAVTRPSQRNAAEEAVRNLTGIRGLENEVRVVPSPLTPSLASDIRAALRRRFGAGAEQIQLEVAGGVVTLRGSAATVAQLEDVEAIVRSMPGIARLDNWMLVGG